MHRYPTPPSTSNSSPKHNRSLSSHKKTAYDHVLPAPTESLYSSYPRRSEPESYIIDNYPPALPAPTESYISAYPTTSKVLTPLDSISNYPDNTIAAHPRKSAKPAKETESIESWERNTPAQTNLSRNEGTKVKSAAGVRISYYNDEDHTPITMSGARDPYYGEEEDLMAARSLAGTRDPRDPFNNSEYNMSKLSSRSKSAGAAAQASLYEDEPTTHMPKVIAQDAYYAQPSPSKAAAHESYFHPEDSVPRLAAQDSYYQSTTPVSPADYDFTQDHPYPSTFDPSFPHRPGPLPHTSSAPLHGENASFYYAAAPQPPHAASYPSSPRPPYSRPASRPYSPYLSRPKPRPGLIKRVGQKLEDFLRAIIRWGRASPLKLGLLTFLPILLSAGVIKTVRSLKRMMVGAGVKGKIGKKGQQMRKEAKKWHEDVFRDFKEFGGSKAGPLDGVLKILQMLMYVEQVFITFNFFSLVSSPLNVSLLLDSEH